MPEWNRLTWGQSTWGDPVSIQTKQMQSLFGGYMPWTDIQLQAGERHSQIRVYAINNPVDKTVVAEIHGIEAGSSLTKQIRDGIIEEQKLALSIADSHWSEYYLHGDGAQYIQELNYIMVQQVIQDTNSLASVPIGIYRISTIPQASDDGLGVSITIEAEDWLASNLRTPFPSDSKPYDVLVSAVEGSININNVPANQPPGTIPMPTGISQERLDLGNSIFGLESNWFHNFFGYIWNFMMDITNEHFIVDPAVVFAARQVANLKVTSPDMVGVPFVQAWVAAPPEGGIFLPTSGPGGPSEAEVVIAGELANLGPITPAVEANVAGTPEQQFGIISFPEGPSIISYLKELIAGDGVISSHSGIKGTYFAYDAEGFLHWKSWNPNNDADLVFTCEPGINGKVSVPVERIETTVREQDYNHFTVKGMLVPEDVPVTITGHPETGGRIIGPDVLPPPDGYEVYGELQAGFYWSSFSTLSITDGTVLEILPGGGDVSFEFKEHLGLGVTRPFDPSYIVAPPGSIISASFYGYSAPNVNDEGAQQIDIPNSVVSRDGTQVTYHFENGGDDSVFVLSWWLLGTVWAPISLWEEPTAADITPEQRWINAFNAYNRASMYTYDDKTFSSRWYKYPGLRDRSLTLFLGEDFTYLSLPFSMNIPPLDPRMINVEMGKNAHNRIESAIQFFCGPAYQVKLTLDSAFTFIDLGKSMRIKYPPENIDGYFTLINVNMPFSEQAQVWTLQWVADA